MREARVRARAIPQLQAALEANEITLYRAGEIAKLPASQQEIAVAQWVSRSLFRTRGQAIAAQVIREFLGDSQPISLAELSAAIRATIRGTKFSNLSGGSFRTTLSLR
jgi:hypothetical protein